MKDLVTEQSDDVQMRALIDGLWRSANFGAVFEKAVHRDVVLHGGEAEYKGRLAVATSALGPMVACPDRHVICEDMVSHKLADARDIGAARLRVSGRHAGGGVWGAPTGRDISYSVMVETTVSDDRITDIWRVRDTGAVLSALDIAPEKWADDMLGATLPDDVVFTDAAVTDHGAEAGNDSDWAHVWSDLLERAMEGGFQLFDQQYDPGAALHYAGGVTAHGPKSAQAFWLNLRSCFPSAEFRILRKLGGDAPLAAPRAALRWEIRGRHDGWGSFGAPTGKEVVILGLSQAEFGPDGVRREWSIFDVGSVWMQIRKGGISSRSAGTADARKT